MVFIPDDSDITKVLCHCKNLMSLQTGQYGWYYRCIFCNDTHSCDQKTQEPLGYPAPKKVRQARTRAHEVFDNAWKHIKISRGEAYYRLSQQLKLTKDECHIAKFDSLMCQKVMSISDKWVKSFDAKKKRKKQRTQNWHKDRKNKPK